MENAAIAPLDTDPGTEASSLLRSARFPCPFPPTFASAWGDDEYGLWADLEVPANDGASIVQKLRWIEPGTFLMGSPEGEAERFGHEGPRHEVTISNGFWLFDTACTQALWQAVMGYNPSSFRGLDRPVENVSWEDIRKFLAKINANGMIPGLELILPSEAQWEYACRAGTETRFSFGDTITPEEVNYNGEKTVPVASLPANAWGLYEMHGNVCEWCQDHWHHTYERALSNGRAWIDERADPGGARVLRGGSWIGSARNVRSASRDHDRPGGRDFNFGFRCARVQEP